MYSTCTCTVVPYSYRTMNSHSTSTQRHRGQRTEDFTALRTVLVQVLRTVRGQAQASAPWPRQLLVYFIRLPDLASNILRMYARRAARKCIESRAARDTEIPLYTQMPRFSGGRLDASLLLLLVVAATICTSTSYLYEYNVVRV